MADEYDLLVEEMPKQVACSPRELIYVTPITVPELEAVFPDTSFFRGGGRWGCVPTDYFDAGSPLHSLVAVRKGQVYPLHVNTGGWGSNSENDGFQAFNRLLKDSGITVTPDNEAMIAKPVVAMMLFYEYDRFFDARTFAVPEQTKPADYRLGSIHKIDEYAQCDPLGGYYKTVNQHFTIGLPSWTSQEGRVDWWRIAFYEGRVSFVQWQELGRNVEKTGFESWVDKHESEIDRCWYSGYGFRRIED